MGQPTFELKGKVAVVTGAAQGIGKAIAETYALAGADLVIADINMDEAEKTAAGINAQNARATAVRCDVRRSGDADDLIRAAIGSYGRVDILVNNAGLSGAAKPLIHMNDEEWHNTQAVNLSGVFFCSRAAAREMKKQNSGKIVNILSMASSQPVLNSGDYCASKGGALMLTKVLALELIKYNIHVNAICPGMFDTNLAPMLKEAVMKNIDRFIPVGRIADVEEIKGLALFLASAASDYVVGTAIPIDGGTAVRGM